MARFGHLDQLLNLEQLVESVISDLSTDHRENFHVVRLNGFIHTDDKWALKEIWRQLGREMDAEDDMTGKVNSTNDIYLQPLLTRRSRTMQIRWHHFWLSCLIPQRYQKIGRMRPPSLSSSYSMSLTSSRPTLVKPSSTTFLI